MCVLDFTNRILVHASYFRRVMHITERFISSLRRFLWKEVMKEKAFCLCRFQLLSYDIEQQYFKSTIYNPILWCYFLVEQIIKMSHSYQKTILLRIWSFSFWIFNEIRLGIGIMNDICALYKNISKRKRLYKET